MLSTDNITYCHIGILKCLVCWVFCLIIDACTSWQWLQTNCMVLSSPKVKISLLKIILDQPCISSNVLHAFGLFYTGQFLHYFSGIIQTCMGQLIFIILQKGMSQMWPLQLMSCLKSLSLFQWNIIPVHCGNTFNCLWWFISQAPSVCAWIDAQIWAFPC